MPWLLVAVQVYSQLTSVSGCAVAVGGSPCEVAVGGNTGVLTVDVQCQAVGRPCAVAVGSSAGVVARTGAGNALQHQAVVAQEAPLGSIVTQLDALHATHGSGHTGVGAWYKAHGSWYMVEGTG